MARHTAQKIRNAGGRLRGNKKRKEESNIIFDEMLRQLIKD